MFIIKSYNYLFYYYSWAGSALRERGEYGPFHGLSMSSFVVFLLDTNFHGRSEKGQVWTTLNPFGPDPQGNVATGKPCIRLVSYP